WLGVAGGAQPHPLAGPAGAARRVRPGRPPPSSCVGPAALCPARPPPGDLVHRRDGLDPGGPTRYRPSPKSGRGDAPHHPNGRNQASRPRRSGRGPPTGPMTALATTPALALTSPEAPPAAEKARGSALEHLRPLGARLAALVRPLRVLEA